MANKFATKFGVVMAAAGSAVGLGNVWRFPYLAGQNGGGAFLLIYLVCILFVGMPIVLSEFVIGRRSGQNALGAMRTLSGSHRWDWLGIMCVVCGILFISFYIVIAGWCVRYLSLSIFHAALPDIANTLIALALNVGIIWFGVEKGIERISTLLMPLLLIILLMLVIRSLTLPGSGEGLKFLFTPDFSKITPSVFMAAISQAFFTLSIGLGCMLTYAAYMKKNQNLIATATQVVGIDTLVAIVAGIAIFPAVFSLGFSPAEGPQLVFSVLPAVFAEMPGGSIFMVLFYILLLIAAITSSISMQEVAVAYFDEQRHMPRRKAILLTTGIIIVLSVLCTISCNSSINLCGRSLFDWFDYLTSKFMMPIGGLAFAIYLGWFYPLKDTREELQQGSNLKPWFWHTFLWTIRIIVPIAILAIFINGLLA